MKPTELTTRRLCQIGIVAHVDRLDMAAALADTVDARVICIDDGTIGCDGNHRRVWTHLAIGDAPWSLVLEDDAVPVRDFTAQLVGVLRNSPAPVVSLYLGRSRPPAWQDWAEEATATADARGDCFIPCNRLLHAVGVAMHRRLVTHMLAQTLDVELPVDEAISAWARWNEHKISYCWPSIVDHRDIPTLVKHPDGKPRTMSRTAWSVGSRNHWHWRST